MTEKELRPIPKEAFKDHNFVFYRLVKWNLDINCCVYKCSKCGILCACSKILCGGWEYYEDKRSGMISMFLEDLTCDEYLIKDIIE